MLVSITVIKTPIYPMSHTPRGPPVMIIVIIAGGRGQPMGQFIATGGREVAALAEFERELICERTKAGIL
jgi:hypothetical protein